MIAILCIDLKELAPICSKLVQREEGLNKKLQKPNKKKSSSRENINSFRPKLMSFNSNQPLLILKLKKIKVLITIFRIWLIKVKQKSIIRVKLRSQSRDSEEDKASKNQMSDIIFINLNLIYKIYFRVLVLLLIYFSYL